jgi:alpha-D-ribose 1-methylphosphonate 5-triphosphate synthase subunit PhnG
MTALPQSLSGWTHAQQLDVLARADATRIKAFAEPLIADLREITVIENRTGLVMLPMRDTAQGTHFHLGEVLVSEAHVSAGGQEGYGMRRGRDLEAAMAMAVVDLAIALGHAPKACDDFLSTEARAQSEADTETLRKVEATRVDMETF